MRSHPRRRRRSRATVSWDRRASLSRRCTVDLFYFLGFFIVSVCSLLLHDLMGFVSVNYVTWASAFQNLVVAMESNLRIFLFLSHLSLLAANVLGRNKWPSPLLSSRGILQSSFLTSLLP
ncbi:hypothetical protein BJX66DRAFT_98834 [Aspergillus keveii]|uniref:Uncharacterized protein n=1 Tax=Aspergillus keveii TaxID=714993 RepID=A0ABR4GNZ7_9EURO